jgi:hypothetical protein
MATKIGAEMNFFSFEVTIGVMAIVSLWRKVFIS